MRSVVKKAIATLRKLFPGSRLSPLKFLSVLQGKNGLVRRHFSERVLEISPFNPPDCRWGPDRVRIFFLICCRPVAGMVHRAL